MDDFAVKFENMIMNNIINGDDDKVDEVVEEDESTEVFRST